MLLQTANETLSGNFCVRPRTVHHRALIPHSFNAFWATLHEYVPYRSIRWRCVALHTQARNLWDNLCTYFLQISQPFPYLCHWLVYYFYSKIPNLCNQQHSAEEQNVSFPTNLFKISAFKKFPLNFFGISDNLLVSFEFFSFIPQILGKIISRVWLRTTMYKPQVNRPSLPSLTSGNLCHCRHMCINNKCKTRFSQSNCVSF